MPFKIEETSQPRRSSVVSLFPSKPAENSEAPRRADQDEEKVVAEAASEQPQTKSTDETNNNNNNKDHHQQQQEKAAAAIETQPQKQVEEDEFASIITEGLQPEVTRVALELARIVAMMGKHLTEEDIEEVSHGNDPLYREFLKAGAKHNPVTGELQISLGQFHRHLRSRKLNPVDTLQGIVDMTSPVAKRRNEMLAKQQVQLYTEQQNHPFANTTSSNNPYQNNNNSSDDQQQQQTALVRPQMTELQKELVVLGECFLTFNQVSALIRHHTGMFGTSTSSSVNSRRGRGLTFLLNNSTSANNNPPVNNNNNSMTISSTTLQQTASQNINMGHSRTHSRTFSNTGQGEGNQQQQQQQQQQKSAIFSASTTNADFLLMGASLHMNGTMANFFNDTMTDGNNNNNAGDLMMNTTTMMNRSSRVRRQSFIGGTTSSTGSGNQDELQQQQQQQAAENDSKQEKSDEVFIESSAATSQRKKSASSNAADPAPQQSVRSTLGHEKSQLAYKYTAAPTITEQQKLEQQKRKASVVQVQQSVDFHDVSDEEEEEEEGLLFQQNDEEEEEMEGEQHQQHTGYDSTVGLTAPPSPASSRRSIMRGERASKKRYDKMMNKIEKISQIPNKVHHGKTSDSVVPAHLLPREQVREMKRRGSSFQLYNSTTPNHHHPQQQQNSSPSPAHNNAASSPSPHQRQAEIHPHVMEPSPAPRGLQRKNSMATPPPPPTKPGFGFLDDANSKLKSRVETKPRLPQRPEYSPRSHRSVSPSQRYEAFLNASRAHRERRNLSPASNRHEVPQNTKNSSNINSRPTSPTATERKEETNNAKPKFTPSKPAPKKQQKLPESYGYYRWLQSTRRTLPEGVVLPNNNNNSNNSNDPEIEQRSQQQHQQQQQQHPSRPTSAADANRQQPQRPLSGFSNYSNNDQQKSVPPIRPFVFVPTPSSSAARPQSATIFVSSSSSHRRQQQQQQQQQDRDNINNNTNAEFSNHYYSYPNNNNSFSSFSFQTDDPLFANKSVSEKFFKDDIPSIMIPERADFVFAKLHANGPSYLVRPNSKMLMHENAAKRRSTNENENDDGYEEYYLFEDDEDEDEGFYQHQDHPSTFGRTQIRKADFEDDEEEVCFSSSTGSPMKKHQQPRKRKATLSPKEVVTNKSDEKPLTMSMLLSTTSNNNTTTTTTTTSSPFFPLHSTFSSTLLDNTASTAHNEQLRVRDDDTTIAGLAKMMRAHVATRKIQRWFRARYYMKRNRMIKIIQRVCRGFVRGRLVVAKLPVTVTTTTRANVRNEETGKNEEIFVTTRTVVSRVQLYVSRLQRIGRGYLLSRKALHQQYDAESFDRTIGRFAGHLGLRSCLTFSVATTAKKNQQTTTAATTFDDVPMVSTTMNELTASNTESDQQHHGSVGRKPEEVRLKYANKFDSPQKEENHNTEHNIHNQEEDDGSLLLINEEEEYSSPFFSRKRLEKNQEEYERLLAQEQSEAAKQMEDERRKNLRWNKPAKVGKMKLDSEEEMLMRFM